MSSTTFDMTHDEIGEFVAERMRKKGYPLCWANMRKQCGEQPDCFAFRGLHDCIVFEVKVSREDFFADQKKPWRAEGKGMGTERIYVTPPNLLRSEEIPYGWKLWEVHGKKRKTLKVIKGRRTFFKKLEGDSYARTHIEDLHTSPKEVHYFRDKCCRDSVVSWLITIMKRAEALGMDMSKLGNCDYLIEKGVYKPTKSSQAGEEEDTEFVSRKVNKILDSFE